MDKQTREALEARFPPGTVKKRRGSFGREISYIEGSAIVARLNDCFDADWSFTIISHEVLETGEVLVHGRLEALGVVKEAFGRGMPAVSKETGAVISMVDAYKQSVSDCIKRAARLMGCAAYLYSDDYQEQPEQPAQRLVPRPTQPTNNNPTFERLTQRQLGSIWSLSRRIGYSAEDIRARCQQAFAAAGPEQLSKHDASALISQLGEELDSSRAAS